MHISNGHAPTDLIFISIKMVLCSYDFYMMSVLSNLDVVRFLSWIHKLFASFAKTVKFLNKYIF